MNSISATSTQLLDSLYTSGSSSSSATTPTAVSGQAPDTAHISSAAMLQIYEAGQITVNQQTGTVTGDQAQQLYTQLTAISTQAATDKQAGGGTISATDKTAIAQMAAQLNQQIQSDGGTSVASSGQTLSLADARQIFQSGRIEIGEQSGALSGAQGSALMTQIDAVGAQNLALQQADGGTVTNTDAKTLNQEQSMISQEIHSSVNAAGLSATGPAPFDPSQTI